MPGVLGKSAVAGVRKRQRFLWLCLWTSVVIPSMPRCGSHRISSGPLSKNFAQAAFAPGGTIHSDGYGSYIPALEGYTHEHKLYDPNSGLLHWLHIVISNAKAFILGTYHGLPKKYLQTCGEYGIVHNKEQIFAYLQTLDESPEAEQISLWG